MRKFLIILLLTSQPLDAQRPRARELGITIGTLPRGHYNAITDVDGVLVGHVTLNWGEGELVVGEGPVRTGVTAVLPHGDDIYQNQVFAAAEVLNGNGEITGTDWINERGLLEVPVILTNTLSVGTAYDGVVAYMLAQDPGRVPLPVVGECYDGGISDIAGRHVKEAHVFRAINTASAGEVAEGSVGAGTGMRMYGFKAGIGTASRILSPGDGGYTVGVLVNANASHRKDWLLVNGVPVGRELAESHAAATRDGSIIILIATDAPLIPIQLRRLCKRAVMGLARTGSVSHTGSGDFILAFSTAQRIPRKRELSEEIRLVNSVEALRDRELTPVFSAVVEATEEAILNSLCVAETMLGRDGRVIPALPHDQLVEILKRHDRLQ